MICVMFYLTDYIFVITFNLFWIILNYYPIILQVQKLFIYQRCHLGWWTWRPHLLSMKYWIFFNLEVIYVHFK